VDVSFDAFGASFDLRSGPGPSESPTGQMKSALGLSKSQG